MNFKHFSLGLLAPVLSICIPAQATTVSLAGSPNPGIFGQPVTLTATVSPGTASGKVTFYSGSQILGLAPVSGGVATLATRQISAGHQVLTARYDGDGSNPIALSNAVPFTVSTLAGSSFASIVNYPAGTNPCCVVTADFNGDGKLDTAVVSGPSQAVFVFLGNGNGTFQAPLTYAAGASPISVAVGDFNGDGKPDLVVANVYDGNVQPAVLPSVDILFGNGDGSFQAPVVYTTDESPYAVAVGDFNNDGYPDVAVANESYSDVSIYFGSATGTLTLSTTYSTGSTGGAVGLAIGDFNGDGYPDLAVSAGQIVILLGTSNGSFTMGSSIPAGSLTNDVQTADLNGDGKLDLVVADYGSGHVDVLLGNGNGTFQPARTYPTLTAPSGILISDFNGDGKLDVVAADYENGSQGAVSVFFGNGDGTLQAAQNTTTGPGAFKLAAGDFNGDGLVDLAVADLGYFNGPTGGLGILLGGCAAVSPTAPLAYDANGGQQSFTITAGPSCSWTATSPASWVTLSATSGTGNGTVVATVQPYAPPQVNPADRTTTLAIAGQNVSVLEDFTVAQFTDVPASSYQFDAVNLLKTKNITAGCGPSTYCPAQIITRAQMAIFIVRAVYGSDNFTIGNTQYFADVSPSTFGYTWIEKMYELGITAGCGGGNYCPDSQVTRDQMAIFIIRARYGANTAFTYNPNAYFQDVPTTDFAFKWVQRMKQDNVTAGCGPNSYCPGSAVTRGDMALFVMRGAFNQLLPPTEPVITSVSPTSLAVGGSATFTVTGLNTNFVQGVTTLVPVAGGGTGGPGQPVSSIVPSNVTVISSTQLTVTLTADPAAPAQPEAVYVQTGSEEAVAPNSVVVGGPI